MGRVHRGCSGAPIVLFGLGLLQAGCQGGATRVVDVTPAGTEGVPPRRSAAVVDVMPPERRTRWEPGIPGGVPARTTVCALVSAAAYGNGVADATAGIQAAIDACPEG